MSATIKLAVYDQGCARAGQLAMDSRTDAADDPGWDSGDITVHEGTAAELAEYADALERDARPAGQGRYDRRVADTIREALAVPR